MKCPWCTEEFETHSALESHEAGHRVKKVVDDPLTFLLVLPDGCTPGRWEAAEAFAEAVAELRQACPDVEFQFVPFSHEWVPRGSSSLSPADIAVTSILAIGK
jgi:hypothetical protein